MNNPYLIEVTDPITFKRAYKIPAGTSVSIRRITNKEWNHSHKTTKDLVFSEDDVIPHLSDKMNIVFSRMHEDLFWMLKINKIT